MTKKVVGTQADTKRGTKQISLYLQTSLIDDAKVVAGELSTPGMRIKYTDVVRLSVEMGLPLMKKGKQGMSLLEKAKLLSSELKVKFPELMEQVVEAGLRQVEKAG